VERIWLGGEDLAGETGYLNAIEMDHIYVSTGIKFLVTERFKA